MTKAEKENYEDADELRRLLCELLAGRKFRLDCGHYCSFGYHLGNDVTICNGNKEFRIICSQCGY